MGISVFNSTVHRACVYHKQKSKGVKNTCGIPESIFLGLIFFFSSTVKLVLLLTSEVKHLASNGF